MTTLPPHRAERAALCDLFDELGPDAPTLCEGWDTIDLAVHLVVRERKPWAAPGILLGGPFAALLDRATEDARRRHPYGELVELIRTGPPMPASWFDAQMNTVEYFVHHEDARRGGGDHTPRPVDEVADVEAALWANLRRGHRMMTRKVKGVQLDLVAPDGDVIHAAGGDETVTLTGRPGELVLYLLGRRDAAQVELEGSERARTVLTGAELGI